MRDLTAKIEVEAAKLMANIRAFAKDTGMTVKAVYLDQLRLASNSLIKSFPPKTANQGRSVIMEDMTSIFTEVGPGAFLQESFDVFGENAPPKVFKTARGAVMGAEIDQFNPRGDISIMHDHHQKYRMKNGRTSKAGSYTRDVGRWKFINRMIVPAGAVKKYAKTKLFPHVGLLKAGWILPANCPVQSKPPAWVAKAGKSVLVGVEFEDKMTPDGNGFLRERNPIEYGSKHQGLIEIELRKRGRDLKRMMKDHINSRFRKYNINGSVA